MMRDWNLILSIRKLKSKCTDKSFSNRKSEQFTIIEYPLIIVFILCGATFLISTADLVKNNT